MKLLLHFLFLSFSLSAAAQPCSLTLSSSPASCYGMGNGTASASATGAGTISYDWSPGNPAGDGTSMITALSAGTYSCTITDTAGCSATNSIVVSQPQFLDTINIIIQGAQCPAYNNGSITINATGGTPPYSYAWQSSSSTSNSLTNLTAGFQAFTITDANGCQINMSLLVQQNDSMQAVAYTNGSNQCSYSCSVIASAGAFGATPPLSYLWSNGYTNGMIAGLCAGTYTVTVTDANGCYDTASVIVTSPPPLSLTADSLVPSSSCAGSDGGIYLSGNGGTVPYRYYWDSGDTTSYLTGISDGHYYCLLADAHNCSTDGYFILNDNPAPAVSMNWTGYVAFGFCDTVNGGSPAGGVYSGGGVSAGGVLFCAITDSGMTRTPPMLYYTITDSAGCSATAGDTVEIVFIISVPEQEKMVSHIQPNPAGDFIIVSAETLGWLHVYNAQGQIVQSVFMSENREEINISALPPGLYFVRHLSENQVDFTERIIISR